MTKFLNPLTEISMEASALAQLCESRNAWYDTVYPTRGIDTTRATQDDDPKFTSAEDVLMALFEIDKNETLTLEERCDACDKVFTSISDDMRKNKEEMLALIAVRPEAILMADKNVVNREFIKDALKYNPLVYEYLPQKIQQDEKMVRHYLETLYGDVQQKHPIFDAFYEKMSAKLKEQYGVDSMSYTEWMESPQRDAYETQLKLIPTWQEQELLSPRCPLSVIGSGDNYQALFRNIFLYEHDWGMHIDEQGQLRASRQCELLGLIRATFPISAAEYDQREIAAYKAVKERLKDDANHKYGGYIRRNVAEFCVARHLPIEPEWRKEHLTVEAANIMAIYGISHMKDKSVEEFWAEIGRMEARLQLGEYSRPHGRENPIMCALMSLNDLTARAPGYEELEELNTPHRETVLQQGHAEAAKQRKDIEHMWKMSAGFKTTPVPIEHSFTARNEQERATLIAADIMAKSGITEIQKCTTVQDFWQTMGRMRARLEMGNYSTLEHKETAVLEALKQAYKQSGVFVEQSLLGNLMRASESVGWYAEWVEQKGKTDYGWLNRHLESAQMELQAVEQALQKEGHNFGFFHGQEAFSPVNDSQNIQSPNETEFTAPSFTD